MKCDVIILLKSLCLRCQSAVIVDCRSAVGLLSDTASDIMLGI